MRFLLLSLLLIDLILSESRFSGSFSDFAEVAVRHHKKQCKNPKGKIEETRQKGCSKLICKAIGKNKAAWSACPKEALETTVTDMKQIINGNHEVETKEINKIQTNQNEQNTYIKIMKTNQNEQNTSINNIKTNQNEQNTNINIIKTNQNEQNTNIIKIQTNQNEQNTIINKIQTNQNEQNTNINIIKSNQNEQNASMKKIQTNQNEQNTNIYKIKTNQNEQNTNINIIKTNQNDQNTKINKIQTNQNEQKTNINIIKTNQNEQNTTINKIETNQNEQNTNINKILDVLLDLAKLLAETTTTSTTTTTTATTTSTTTTTTAAPTTKLETTATSTSTTATTITTTKKECGSDWTVFESHCYKYFGESLSFLDAEAQCQQEGAHLTSILSQEENQFLLNLYSWDRIWIGANDFDTEGKWEWTDGSTWNFSYWSSGEPNNSGGEHCAMPLKSRIGKWNDDKCDKKIPFICKKYTASAETTTTSTATAPTSTTTTVVTTTTATTAAETTTKTCPIGWSMFHSKCYRVYSSAKTWTGGQEECEKEGATLASIADEATNSFVSKLGNGEDRIYIGGYEPTPKAWTWIDGSQWVFTNWDSGEPGGNEPCAVFITGSGKWHDYPCHEQFAYVCILSSTTKLTTLSTSTTTTPTTGTTTSTSTTTPIPAGNRDPTSNSISRCEASNNQGGYHCSKATDGDLRTAWAYSASLPAWVVLHLDNPGSTNTIIIKTGWYRHDHHINDFSIEVKVGDKFEAVKVTKVNSAGATIQENKVKIGGQKGVRVAFEKKTGVSAVRINAYGSDAGNDNSVLNEIFVLNLKNVDKDWSDDVDLILNNIDSELASTTYTTTTSTSTSTTTTIPAVCSSDWTVFGSNCYKHFAEKLIWADAEAKCLQEGSHLASILSDEENKFLVKLTSLTSDTWGVGWVGGNDLGTEGVFEWTDGSPWNYDNWQSGEPNSASEDCVVPLKVWNGKWNDAGCGTQLSYICKKLTTTTATTKLPYDNLPCGVIFMDADIPGNDIGPVHQPVPTSGQCQDLCILNSACLFWTWVDSHYSSKNIVHRCFLKNGNSGLNQNRPGLVSGTSTCLTTTATTAGTSPCEWTGWLDRDDPSGTQDNEEHNIGCTFNKIEMRVVGKTDIYTTEAEVVAGTGDIIHITDQGMYCKWRNGETQPDGKCLDYEIRMCCSTN